MDIKYGIIIFLCLFYLFRMCQPEPYLSHFKDLEYNYLFSENDNYSTKNDYVYIKKYDYENKDMINKIQEFAIYYAKLHPEMSVIYISDENNYPADEYDPKSLRASIYLTRDSNEVRINKIVYFNN